MKLIIFGIPIIMLLIIGILWFFKISLNIYGDADDEDDEDYISK